MNRGAQRLKELNLNQAQIAQEVGTTQGVVSRWERGERKPNPLLRAKLEKSYGIGWQLWDEEVSAETVKATGTEGA